MAANMQHMAAAGQMMPQQMRKPNQNSALQQYVYTYLMQNTPPTNGMSWQANVTIGTRLGNALNLYVLYRCRYSVHAAPAHPSAP